MIVEKKVSFDTPFAKKGEDIKDGDIITILDEGREMDGKFGKRLVFKIKTPNGEKMMSFNQSSINNLIDAYGKDTAGWVNKEAQVWMVKGMVSGKMQNIVYLSAPGWLMTDDGSFVPPSEE